MKISGRRGEDSNLEILDKIPGQCCQNVRNFDKQKTGGVGEGKFKKCSSHPKNRQHEHSKTGLFGVRSFKYRTQGFSLCLLVQFQSGQ